MRISTKGRHAVMAMVDLARNSRTNPSSPVSLAEISQRQEISLSYLEQLVAMLKSHGIVKSVRGPGGGYLLAMPSDVITIAQIIAAVDDHAPRVHITDPSKANGRQLTDLLWQSIGDEVSSYLQNVTLADVEKCSLCHTAANDSGTGGSPFSSGTGAGPLGDSGAGSGGKIEAQHFAA